MLAAHHHWAPVAQRIEQPPPKRKVAGSTPAWGTILCGRPRFLCGACEPVGQPPGRPRGPCDDVSAEPPHLPRRRVLHSTPPRPSQEASHPSARSTGLPHHPRPRVLKRADAKTHPLKVNLRVRSCFSENDIGAVPPIARREDNAVRHADEDRFAASRWADPRQANRTRVPSGCEPVLHPPLSVAALCRRRARRTRRTPGRHRRPPRSCRCTGRLGEHLDSGVDRCGARSSWGSPGLRESGPSPG